MRNHTDKAAKAAKQLRAELSLPEALLLRLLKGKPLGVNFRCQHPIGAFVAGFYCHTASMIIESDGLSHDMGDRPARDNRRDRWLNSCGLTVVRIPANEVLRDPGAVAASNIALCSAAPPPSALRAATSPEGGASLEMF